MDANLFVKTEQNISDEQLMLDYAKGDNNSFDQLYARHKGGIYRYFLRQCSDQQQAEELFQDVWTRLINARKSYKPEARFTTWLYTLAHNRLIDWYRKQGIVRAAFPAGADQEAEADSSWQPENDLQRQRLANCLQEAIAALPEDQREVFMLKQEAGLTINEIAVVIEADNEACKSRYRYAIKKLRHWLQHSEACQ